MRPLTLKRHRDTWPTTGMVLILALGTCLMIMGVFNLATDVLFGLGLTTLGIGLFIPGVWWIRWYQKPQLLGRLLPISIIFIILGMIGIIL